MKECTAHSNDADRVLVSCVRDGVEEYVSFIAVCICSCALEDQLERQDKMRSGMTLAWGVAGQGWTLVYSNSTGTVLSLFRTS